MSEGRDPAAAFSRMAERIAAMKPEEFAGAVVVMSPDGSSMEFLLADPGQSVANFWNMAKTRFEIAYAEIETRSREQELAHARMYGRR